MLKSGQDLGHSHHSRTTAHSRPWPKLGHRRYVLCLFVFVSWEGRIAPARVLLGPSLAVAVRKPISRQRAPAGFNLRQDTDVRPKWPRPQSPNIPKSQESTEDSNATQCLWILADVHRVGIENHTSRALAVRLQLGSQEIPLTLQARSLVHNPCHFCCRGVLGQRP